MSKSNIEQVFEDLCHHMRKVARLTSMESILGWDERTHMPPTAGPYRTEQLSYLAGEIHRLRTQPCVGEWLEQLVGSDLASDTHSPRGATVRWLKRQYDKQSRLPQRLVEEIAQAASQGEQAWGVARPNNDFQGFAPHLERIIALKREQAEAYGYEESIYDPLLDDFEPGATSAKVTQVLNQLREELVPLVQAIDRSAARPNAEILRRRYPAPGQDRLARTAIENFGFDFSAGQLDTTLHPFCATLGPRDIRITTRYDEQMFASAFFSTLHEAGHGLYEQGLPEEWFGLPPGEAVSLGIHESQSRLWENMVGRNPAFWKHYYPAAQQEFPDALGNVSLDDFCFAINEVTPSLIRVEADEATYNLHIIVRFELEQALLAGDLSIADLPGAWNEKYAEYLGITPSNHSEGAMQDVHWSAGLFGYFPTYALGNLYGAQFFERANAELENLDDLLERGDFPPLLSWLQEEIYSQGCKYSASELIEHVTEKPLSHEPLLHYLRSKYAPLYGV